MKPAPAPNVPGNSEAERSRTIDELNARCDGPNQFDNFDRAFRKTLTVSKSALLKEEARLKRARTRKRAKKTAS
jgi:hypothetical protein